MLGSLLQQLMNGLEAIPEEIVQGYREQREAIDDRGLMVSGLVGVFRSPHPHSTHLYALPLLMNVSRNIGSRFLIP